MIAPSGTLVELQPNFVTMGLNREWDGFPRTALPALYTHWLENVLVLGSAVKKKQEIHKSDALFHEFFHRGIYARLTDELAM